MTVTEDVAPSATAAGPTAGNRFVGQRVQRREDARLVTGHGTYVDDIVVPGMLHVAFVRSDVACGAITALDVSAARELPGVVAVFTGADLNGDVVEGWVDFEGGESGRPFRVLADGDVRFAGEPVALVVAESRYVVEVEIDPVDAVIGHDAALADGPVPCIPSGRTTSPDTFRPATTRSSTRSSPKPPLSSRRRSISIATCACRWSAAAWSRSGMGSATSSWCTRRPRARTACVGSCRGRWGCRRTGSAS